MSLALRVTVAVLCIAFALLAFRLISAGRLLLRYSLMWFAFAAVALACALFPEPLFAASAALGFATASNFVLLLGLVCSLAIMLSMTVALSRLAKDRTMMLQEIALMRHEIEGCARAGGSACHEGPDAGGEGAVE